MDRQMVYPSALPRSLDILSMNKNMLYGLAYLSEALIGLSTGVSGLAISATGPASLNVVIGRGSIYSETTVDATAFAGAGTDAHVVLKQGILNDPATLSISPPGTSGYSQVYLVQVAYNDVDSSLTLLPYYNAANPQVPYAGPNNDGTSQFTVRSGVCVVALKAGTAAPTGSQTVPSADAGYTALYAITVANGQTSITSADWFTLPTAPFIVRTKDAALASYGVDTGTATAFAANVVPLVTAYADGHIFEITPAHTNTTTTPTLNINALGAKTIVHSDGTAIGVGEIVASRKVLLAYDSTLDKIVLLSAPNLSYLDNRYTKLVAPPSGNNFYVDASLGNDSNDGLAAGSGRAFQSIAGAVAAITNRYITSGTVNLHIAAGSYAGFSISTSFIGAWDIIGDPITPTNCVIDASPTSGGVPTVNNGRAFGASSGASVTIAGFKLISFYENVNIGSGASCDLSDCAYTAPTSGTASVIIAGSGAFIFAHGTNNSFTGTAAAFFSTILGGSIEVAYHDAATTNSFVLTLSSAAFTTAFVTAGSGGNVSFNMTYSTFPGSATGPLYFATLNGVIDTAATGTLPGSTGGSTSYGGQFI